MVFWWIVSYSNRELYKDKVLPILVMVLYLCIVWVFSIYSTKMDGCRVSMLLHVQYHCACVSFYISLEYHCGGCVKYQCSVVAVYSIIVLVYIIFFISVQYHFVYVFNTLHLVQFTSTCRLLESLCFTLHNCCCANI